MCLAVPGKILSVEAHEEDLKMAKVSFGGVVKDVCLDFVPEARQGDYVLVHVGFAINVLNEQEAEETLNMLSEILEAEEQL